MKVKKWYQSWGYWIAIQVLVLITFGVLGNWFDWASIAGGFMLVWITIPFLVLAATVQTIKKVRGGNK